MRPLFGKEVSDGPWEVMVMEKRAYLKLDRWREKEIVEILGRLANKEISADEAAKLVSSRMNMNVSKWQVYYAMKKLGIVPTRAPELGKEFKSVVTKKVEEAIEDVTVELAKSMWEQVEKYKRLYESEREARERLESILDEMRADMRRIEKSVARSAVKRRAVVVYGE